MLTLFLTKNLYFCNPKILLNTFFRQFVLCLTSNNSSSQNIEGRMHGPSLLLKFWGTIPTVPPKSPPMLAPIFKTKSTGYIHFLYSIISCCLTLRSKHFEL